MPKTVVSIKSTMRDHTMSVPAPENTVAFGIPNACTECHTDRKPAWAVEVLGNGGRRTPREACRARRSLHRRARESARGARASDRDRGGRHGVPLIRANAAGYLRNYADPRAGAALLAAAKAGHPVLRAVAISSLGQRAAENDPARAAVLAALDDPQRAVRIAALVSLVNMGGSRLAPADLDRFRRVGGEFAKMEHLYRDDAGFERDLGVVHLLDGQHDLAAQSLEISLGLEPERPSARFLLASRASASAASTTPARC
jgi:hypothetical protein